MRADRTTRRGRPRSAWLVFAVLLFAFTASADLRPRVILSWETRDVGGIRSSRLRQDIDVFLSRAFTETIELQMNLGANHYELATERLDLATSDTSALELRPSGNLRADFGPVATETTWAFRRSRHDVDGIQSRRDNEQIGARASWAPSKFVPGANFRAWRYRIDDRDVDRSIVSDLVSGSLDYSWKGLAANVGQSYRVEGDNRGGYERTTVDQTAGLNYASTFAGGKLSVSSASNVALTRIEDDTTGGARIPTYVPVARALWGVDDTPLDSFDHPLSPYPALNDGRIGVSTGIDFGPDGASFQAIAFDIGRVSAVDEIQIVVRDERIEPVISYAGIQFDVYTSVDGERWTLDPLAPTVADGFGGENSRVAVLAPEPGGAI